MILPLIVTLNSQFQLPQTLGNVYTPISPLEEFQVPLVQAVPMAQLGEEDKSDTGKFKTV